MDLFQGFTHFRDSNKASCIFATPPGATLEHTKPVCYGLNCVFPQMVKNPSANVADASLISGSEDPLEEGMATRCSILPWRIPWTEEPGRLWSTGSQRVRHD